MIFMIFIHYIIWHYSKALRDIVRIWRNFLIGWWNFFSIGLLAKTLIVPWKRTVTLKASPGFDLKEFLGRASWNLFARLIGLIIRTFFISIGLLIELGTMILGILFLIFWVTLPFWLLYFIVLGWWLALILIVLSIVWIFYHSEVKTHPYLVFPSIKKLKSDSQDFSKSVSFFSAKILNKAIRKPSSKQIAVLIKELIEHSKEVKRVLFRLGLNYRELKKYLSDNKSEPIQSNVLHVLEEASFSIRAKKHLKIRPGDLFYVLAINQPILKQYFFAKDIESKDIFNVVYWVQAEDDFYQQKHKFWQLERLLRLSGIGKAWAYGYSVHLDKYSADLTTHLKGQPSKLGFFAHQNELKTVEQVLARAGENNVLLIGQPGVGRKTIVFALADLVATGRVWPALEYKRVVELDLGLLFAGLRDAGQLRQRVLTVFAEAAKAGNIIMVIDEFHNIIESEAFQTNLLQIILPYLGSKKFQIIGLTDYENFHKSIEPNSQLLKLFEKVTVKEPTADETLLILEENIASLEQKSKITVSYQALKEIVKKADLYIQGIPFPEKALDLLDELVVYVKKQTKDGIILPSHVNQLISIKTGIPVGKIGEEEKAKLINLEQKIHQKIINQEEAVKAVSDALRRARTGLAAKKRPIGVFLFFGPTGVGKTSLARALAETFFGSEKRMIRLDMSEFKDDSSTDNLIGSFEPSKPGILTSAIREKPYTLVLLDEIEKASKGVLDLFLEAFDEGKMRDVFGKTVSFRNTIIIATSNAGAELIRSYIKEGRNLAEAKKEILDLLQSKGIFKPEFLNRFDAVILFQPLSKENLSAIAQMQLEELNQRLLDEHDIKLAITPELKQKIVELGYSPEYGARPMRRVIQDKLEALMAKKILAGETKRGQEIIIKPEEI